jgi:hypothetical protein
MDRKGPAREKLEEREEGDQAGKVNWEGNKFVRTDL